MSIDEHIKIILLLTLEYSVKKIRTFLGKFFLVSIPTILITIFLLEIGLRLFVDVSDMTMQNYYDTETDLFQFKPNTQGTVVLPAYTASYRINPQGWNSHHDYIGEKQPDETRIAIIGDSFIAAQSVDYDKQIAPVLENMLNQDDANNVVAYNFGVWGAPMSQYLAMARHVAATYNPDIFVIVVIRNDFTESWQQLSGRSQFLQFNLDENDQIVEIPPTPFVPNFSRRIFRTVAPQSSLIRYFMYNLNFLPYITARDQSVIRVEGNTGLTSDDQLIQSLDQRMVRYVFEALLNIIAESNSQLMIVMDTDRDQLYRGTPVDEWYHVNRYNLLVAAIADELEIPYIDMTQPFLNDYQIHGKAFDYGELDFHWNAYGHAVVAQTLGNEIVRRGWVHQLPQD